MLQDFARHELFQIDPGQGIIGAFGRRRERPVERLGYRNHAVPCEFQIAAPLDALMESSVGQIFIR